MKMMKNEYTVITGDLVGSRAVLDRVGMSKLVNSAILRVNKEYSADIFAPLALTRGIDEFSGVLKSPRNSYRICRMLNESIYPHYFRFAVVRGVLDVGVHSKDAAKMDGPAFHDAASILKDAKKSQRLFNFKIHGPRGPLDSLINELAQMVHIVKEDRTAHQRKVVEAYEKNNNQALVSRKLSISQQAVSDALKQAGWKDIKRSEDIIDKALEEF
jgi:hypothetical protein